MYSLSHLNNSLYYSYLGVLGGYPLNKQVLGTKNLCLREYSEQLKLHRISSRLRRVFTHSAERKIIPRDSRDDRDDVFATAAEVVTAVTVVTLADNLR